jgi:hypothetical protein
LRPKDGKANGKREKRKRQYIRMAVMVAVESKKDR